MLKVYLAAPIVGADEVVTFEVGQVKGVFKFFENNNEMELYDPKEHGVPNAWGMSMSEWARCIFALDVVAIDNADWVVVCDYGRKGTAGTAWEAGYAFGKGKKVLIIEMADEDTDYSVMMRGCCANYISLNEFLNLSVKDTMKLFVERGRLTQKETLN